MNAQKILATVQFLGSTAAKFGKDEAGHDVSVERYFRGPLRYYRVVRSHADGFRVSMDSASSEAVAAHLAAVVKG